LSIEPYDLRGLIVPKLCPAVSRIAKSDVVAAKHRRRGMARNALGHRFRHPCPHHRSDPRPPKVMQQDASITGLATGWPPRLVNSRWRLRSSAGWGHFADLRARSDPQWWRQTRTDTWRGIGDVVAGMARQEYDLELRALRRPGLARHLLPERFWALADVAWRRRVGAKPMGGGAARGRGCATQARGPGRRAERLDCDRRVAAM